ncbi:MAG: substrate-binding domain-containing protein [Planctomycetota bacterium]|nr:substrate-binding domain-containing protein [Planctomycetota bacterium]
MSRAFLPLLLLAVGAIALFVSGYDGPAAGERSITLATTTSTENSGLLSHLLEPWSEATGIQVKVIAVGTGRALALGERGDADLVLVHARSREDAFIAAGHGIDRRDVMWNDFVIVGPPSDPAGIRGMRDAGKALAAIAANRALFVSRGDDSGTHIRELELWAHAGVYANYPSSGADTYLKAGQGMGPCLTMADQRRAYVLTDRGTFLAARRTKDLEVLVEGDPHLRNAYGAMLVNPQRHPHARTDAARRLLDHLTSPEGQARIGAFRMDGEVLFHPHAAGD